MKIKVSVLSKDIEIEAELDDSETSREIYSKLPIDGEINRWGEEIYFKIPVDLPLFEPKKQNMDVGDLGYWPEGQAFCIFFGKTPASINSEPRAISPATYLGKIDKKDAKLFKETKDGESIKLYKV